MVGGDLGAIGGRAEGDLGRSEGDRGGRSRSPSATRSDTSKIPCKFFAEGRCTKGDKCPFLHAPKEGGGGVAALDPVVAPQRFGGAAV